MDIHHMTISEAARLIAVRKLSPVELVKTLLKRIEAFDTNINAFITVTAEQAMARARNAENEIQRGHYRGALHGIPFAVKDIYQTAGIRTTGHSKVFESFVPPADATAIKKLYDAGAILIGKLATHELAHGGPSFDLPWPPARNPWNVNCFTGGSSSGSGAAIAAGFALGALGSDTGGSIRTPASLCGITALKPTYGLVSRHGVIPNSFSLDHCGPMAWTVEDCALLLQTIAGHDVQDMATVNAPIPEYCSALDRDIRGVRIGVVRHFWEEDVAVNEELRTATESALRTFSTLGAKVKTVRMRPMQNYYDFWNIIEEPEVFSVHRKALTERPTDFGSVFLGRTLAACLIQAGDYIDAQRERTRMVQEMRSIYTDVDVLITAGAGPAPELGPKLSAWPRPNAFVPFNMTGGPALVCCIGFSSSGLPMSMQIAGRPFAEATVFKVAHAYEAVTDWRKTRPVLTNAKHKHILQQPDSPSIDDVDENVYKLCRHSAKRAGLKLKEEQLAQMAAKAPYLIAMLERARRFHEQEIQPSSIFSMTALA